MPDSSQIVKDFQILEESLLDKTQRLKQTNKKRICKKTGNSGNKCYNDIIKILRDIRGNNTGNKKKIYKKTLREIRE